MPKRFLLMLIYFGSASPALFAQHMGEGKDSAFHAHQTKYGEFEGHARLFFMNTINEGSLDDHYAQAAGAGLSYRTPKWKGFTAGMSGYFIFNLFSSNLAAADPITGQKNRYEIGLFDIEDHYNKSDLDRLEELYLNYKHKNTSLTLGRQFISTPFVNKQDGRMRPTIVEAAWLTSGLGKKLTVQGGWVRRMSPRTTVSWYDIGESVGVYAPGVDEEGKKSLYPGNTESKGIAIAGLQYRDNLMHIQAWNTYVENLMNTILVQPEIRVPLNEKGKLMAGVQYVYQNAAGNGGNEDPDKKYYPENGNTWIISSRLGYESPQWKTNVNYTRFSDNSRFLMPREWGRDPFYTFLPRERNEGLGDVHAFTINNEFTTPDNRWKFGLSYGNYQLPDPGNFRLNKYGLPSYHQVNALMEHRFGGRLKNMNMQMLLVWKGKMHSGEINPGYIINRVNMLNSNLVFNYHF